MVNGKQPKNGDIGESKNNDFVKEFVDNNDYIIVHDDELAAIQQAEEDLLNGNHVDCDDGVKILECVKEDEELDCNVIDDKVVILIPQDDTENHQEVIGKETFHHNLKARETKEKDDFCQNKISGMFM